MSQLHMYYKLCTAGSGGRMMVLDEFKSNLAPGLFEKSEVDKLFMLENGRLVPKTKMGGYDDEQYAKPGTIRIIII